MESSLDWHNAKALLEWQIELGAIDAIGNEPVDRYALGPPASPQRSPQHPPATQDRQSSPTPPPPAPEIDHGAIAHRIASATNSIEDLYDAVVNLEGIELIKGARNTLIGAGNPASRVMIIVDAPTRDEDRAGSLFVGAEGTLFDRMFDAIGLKRAAPDPGSGLYLACLIPWRLPNEREISENERVLLEPFLQKHIELAAPDVIVVLGNFACKSLLPNTTLTQARGKWHSVSGIATIALAHPRYLLRNPTTKRDAWADLLQIKSKLKETT